mmetsp:Transcript_12249/g.27010  ORF Transcript_12249/g.27010 Transcript_12249/m.27010 type:complete len:265 (-) Transcript_12249:1991-2785(-)
MSVLSKTVAVVTGGGSGLGAAAVRSLLRRPGVQGVVVGDCCSEEAFAQNVLRETAPSDKGRVMFCNVDVTKADSISAALDVAQDRFGPISAVVNSAGIATAAKTLNKKGLPHKEEEFIKTISVNTIGSFQVARLAAERMQYNKPSDDGLRGCIIQTASIAAFEGQIGQVAYAASKAAIVGMTLPMARDLAGVGIRVMTIAPGLFRTPLLDGLPEAVRQELGSTVPCPSRLGNPAEYGELVVSILENKMLNGSVIRLDGALRMPP